MSVVGSHIICSSFDSTFSCQNHLLYFLQRQREQQMKPQQIDIDNNS
jgi:hypothetical protein